MSCTVLYQKAERYTGENMTQYHIMAPSTEAGWRARAIFTWMRIVRAGKNRQARRRSDTWRANEQQRLHQLHARSQTAPIATQIRQPYTWREQTEISRETGATSGAAAVILKRRRATACMNDDVPAAEKRVTTDGEQSTQHTRERRVDSQLIFRYKRTPTVTM